MFSIGLGELIIILLVVIIFFKPSDLPKIAKALGTWYAKIKELYNGVNEIKEKTIDIIESELSSDKSNEKDDSKKQ